uniref:Uncharacterized protein n=1 Tax=Eptatretus burgeri TaxID=7764 RepID=A0A8C4RC98_EPTBU
MWCSSLIFQPCRHRNFTLFGSTTLRSISRLQWLLLYGSIQQLMFVRSDPTASYRHCTSFDPPCLPPMHSPSPTQHSMNNISQVSDQTTFKPAPSHTGPGRPKHGSNKLSGAGVMVAKGTGEAEFTKATSSQSKINLVKKAGRTSSSRISQHRKPSLKQLGESGVDSSSKKRHPISSRRGFPSRKASRRTFVTSQLPPIVTIHVKNISRTAGENEIVQIVGKIRKVTDLVPNQCCSQQQGPRGLPGPPGPPGPEGRSGPEGAKGDKGYKGIMGTTGIAGLPGHHGPPGVPSILIYKDPEDSWDSLMEIPFYRMLKHNWPVAIGLTGRPGRRGAAGLPGPPGNVGSLGEKGERGVPGEIGRRGAMGHPGRPGADGIPGKNEANGEIGQPGYQGKQGERGIRGPPGDRGKQGIQGKPGPPGDLGKRGEKGQKGTRGIQGDPGALVSVTMFIPFARSLIFIPVWHGTPVREDGTEVAH